MQSRITAMQTKFGAQLDFLVVEFTKLEVQLSQEVGLNAGADVVEGTQQQQPLARLRFFIEHVRHTTERINQAKSGLHHYTLPQLDMLEEHITQRLLPVRDRMIAQLAQRSLLSGGDNSSDSSSSSSSSNDSSTPTSAAVATIPPKVSDTPTIDGNLTALGGGVAVGGGKDDATAVSDGWMGSACCPSPSDVVAAAAATAAAAAAAASSATGDSSEGVTNGGMLAAASMPRPCSSLSLGDLCGDQEGDDDCGGVFLVGGDCDDVHGSGIGLDLYDLGQGKDSFLPLQRERRVGRFPSISTLSSISAMTDGELSDDSLAGDADAPLGAAEAGGVERIGVGSSSSSSSGGADTDASSSGASPGKCTSHFIKGGIDQEMGELSELFAPDAFLLSTILDTEEMEATAGAAETAATVTAITIDPAVKEEETERGMEVEAETRVGEGGASKREVVVSNQQPATAEAGAVAAAAAASVSTAVPIPESLSPSSSPASLPPPYFASPADVSPASAVVVPSPALSIVGVSGGHGTRENGHAAAAAAATAAASAAAAASSPPAVAAAASSTGVAAMPSPGFVSAATLKQPCRCGEAACPSLTSSLRKRPAADLSSSSSSSSLSSSSSSSLSGLAGGGGARGGVSAPGTNPVAFANGGASSSSGNAPLSSLVSGMAYAHQQTSRQRKRQRSLAPVLSAPRTVSYECAVCKESYQAEIASNPWWSLFRQECPRCHRLQIPRVDDTSAAVSVDYIHAVCAEEGEGCDSDGYGSDSGSESEDDGAADPSKEGIAAFDTEVIAGDGSPGCPEGRLSTFQASRLLVLMAHARTCPGRHANPQHAEVCRSTKFLMLHVRDCNGYVPSGEPCEHPWCRPCKSLLSHLVRCPMPSTCRICTPLDLPAPLRQLRDLNVAQARAAAAAAAGNATATATASGNLGGNPGGPCSGFHPVQAVQSVHRPVQNAAPAVVMQPVQQHACGVHSAAPHPAHHHSVRYSAAAAATVQQSAVHPSVQQPAVAVNTRFSAVVKLEGCGTTRAAAAAAQSLGTHC